MITATKAEATRVIDLYAVRMARDAIVIADVTGSVERMRHHLEHAAALYADKLMSDGVGMWEADAVAERFLKSALWCLHTDATLPDEILADAIARADMIYSLCGDPVPAVQLTMWACLSAAQEVMTGAELTAFTVKLERALVAVASGTAGSA